MTPLDRLAPIAAAVWLAMATGCSSGSAGGASEGGAAEQADVEEPADASAADAAPTYAPTFTAVYGEILGPICAGPFCHASDQDSFLSMTTQDVAYSAMVGVVSHGPECADSGLTIVQPDDPDASLLYLKVTTPPCGKMMPANYGPPLDSRQTGQIRQWIALGALND